MMNLRCAAKSLERSGAGKLPVPCGERLRLYRRAGRALNTFFDRWTGPFCGRCLEVTARAHPGEAGAAMELVRGRFAGCCQAGVAEALSVPCEGGTVPFSAVLAERMLAERSALGAGADAPRGYTLRERASGRLVEGGAAGTWATAGCRLGELKAPLCLTYLCTGVRGALEAAAGPGCCGDGDENFCGAAEALRAVVAELPEEAERQVAALEARMGHLARRLEGAGFRSGRELLGRWLRGPRSVRGNHE